MALCISYRFKNQLPLPTAYVRLHGFQTAGKSNGMWSGIAVFHVFSDSAAAQPVEGTIVQPLETVQVSAQWPVGAPAEVAFYAAAKESFFNQAKDC